MTLELNACQIWLEQVANVSADKNRFKSIIKNIKYLRNKPKVITVAGTNGKGTTVLAIEAILRAAGYQVATYTSPHIITLNERCRLNGQSVSAEQFKRVFAQAQLIYQDQDINWFEFLTVTFLLLCAESALDFILVEVGLGGRECVTNCIEPDISVVTSIALDHTAILGETRAAIAYQKAGIFRAGQTAICGDPNPPQTLMDCTLKIGSNLLIQNKDFFYQRQGERWSWQGPEHSFTELPLPKIPLQNASTALAVLQFCSIPEAAIYQGFTHLQVPGRMQVLAERPQVLCDVAHNPHACEYLAGQLAVESFTRTYAIVSMKANKDIAGSLAPLLPLVSEWFLLALPNEAAFVDQAVEYLLSVGAHYHLCADAESALQKARAIAVEDDRIIVFGSFQLVGRILQTYESSQS